MTNQTRFVEAVDVLNFRGNKSFGEGGEHGESQMPPKPSIFAGALRSNWLAQQKIDIRKFKSGQATLPPAMFEQLGAPANPGSFRIQGLWLGKKISNPLANCQHSGAQAVELMLPVPSDGVILNPSFDFSHRKTI